VPSGTTLTVRWASWPRGVKRLWSRLPVR